jgi:hypothetical protein
MRDDSAHQILVCHDVANDEHAAAGNLLKDLIER